jgi:aminopeptidase N
MNNRVHANVKSVVYCSGMKLGDQASWDFLFERYINAFETATEQALMLTALGCSSDPAILQA